MDYGYCGSDGISCRREIDMKKIRNFAIAFACGFFAVVSVPVSAANKALVTAAQSAGTSKTVASTRNQKQRWVKLKNGKKRYYREGKYLTGFQKIGKNTYYFSSKGYMQTGQLKIKKTTYYFSDKGVLEGKKTGSGYYYPSGKKMGKTKALDFSAYQNAREIAAKITTSHMTKSQKLERCFKWVMDKPYVQRRPFKNVSGWPAVFANDHFVYGGGDCISDACAFAYLAKVIGYKNVYVCTDSTVAGSHGWAEINGRVFDPLFAQAKSYSRNYNVPYGIYPLSKVLHVKI